ncbi:GH25 family lysozyme [Candidatus Merdisoma sp. JLR.KK006]|uniref:GH25 family lysozyme n=1 Tax=Candidatus Merdisoma sp. JLR.KK006 TaxID=3112626 RepID=UPI002FF16F11
MSKNVLYEGPDLSYHNGNVDIKRIRDAGYKRVGLRAGYGKNNVDQKYVTNALACFNLGMKVLLYWFSYAYTTAMSAAEAGYVIAQAKKYWVKCPIAFDFEYDSVNYARKNGVVITKRLCTDMAIAFLKAVKDSGYIPVIYTNKDYLKNYFDMSRIAAELGQVYVWYARYTSSLSDDESKAVDIWQYTSSGKIPGVPGKVDLNKFYTNFYFEEQIPTVQKPVCNINILNFQRAANKDGYRDADGKPLIEDGIDGPKTQYVRKQIFLKAKLLLFVGSTGALVEWHQTRCNEILGHNQTVDGKFGKVTRSETLELQKELGLKEDGVAGYNTIQAEFYA